VHRFTHALVTATLGASIEQGGRDSSHARTPYHGCLADGQTTQTGRRAAFVAGQRGRIALYFLLLENKQLSMFYTALTHHYAFTRDRRRGTLPVNQTPFLRSRHHALRISSGTLLPRAK